MENRSSVDGAHPAPDVLSGTPRTGSPGTLDSALLAQARESGADVRFGVRRHEAGPGTIVVTGSDRADGLAPRVHVPHLLPDLAHAMVHRLLAPGGYSHLLIWDGCGTVATTLFGTAFVGQRQRWRAARDATAALIAPPSSMPPDAGMTERRPESRTGRRMGIRQRSAVLEVPLDPLRLSRRPRTSADQPADHPWSCLTSLRPCHPRWSRSTTSHNAVRKPRISGDGVGCVAMR